MHLRKHMDSYMTLWIVPWPGLQPGSSEPELPYDWSKPVVVPCRWEGTGMTRSAYVPENAVAWIVTEDLEEALNEVHGEDVSSGSFFNEYLYPSHVELYLDEGATYDYVDASNWMQGFMSYGDLSEGLDHPQVRLDARGSGEDDPVDPVYAAWWKSARIVDWTSFPDKRGYYRLMSLEISTNPSSS